MADPLWHSPKVIPLALIDPRPDARPLDMPVVEALARSIKSVGLMNPIQVREKWEPGTEDDNSTGRFEVVAGHHRLEALKLLGGEPALCTLVRQSFRTAAPADDLAAELMAIDENLVRAELSPADRARLTARRKAIYEQQHPEETHGGDRRSDQVADLATRSAERFTEATSKTTGQSERKVQLDAERGSKISPEALVRVAGTKLDKGDFLDKLKRVPREEQVRHVEEALVAKPTPRRPRKPTKPTPAAPSNATEEMQLGRLMSAWKHAAPKVREMFLNRLQNGSGFIATD